MVDFARGGFTTARPATNLASSRCTAHLSVHVPAAGVACLSGWPLAATAGWSIVTAVYCQAGSTGHDRKHQEVFVQLPGASPACEGQLSCDQQQQPILAATDLPHRHPIRDFCFMGDRRVGWAVCWVQLGWVGWAGLFWLDWVLGLLLWEGVVIRALSRQDFWS